MRESSDNYGFPRDFDVDDFQEEINSNAANGYWDGILIEDMASKHISAAVGWCRNNFLIPPPELDEELDKRIFDQFDEE